MKAARSLVRAGALVATAALLVPFSGYLATPAFANQRADVVSMTVDSITPWTPTPTQAPTPITVQLTLESSTDISGVTVKGERGAPLTSQPGLDASLADPSPPATSGLPIPAQPPVSVDLTAGQPTTVTFRTTTSTVDHAAGICLCVSLAVYPLFFSAHQTVNGVDQRLGVVASYLPAFYPQGFHQQVSPVHVSWLWPLLDRPHRSTSDTVFTDDDLATELGSEGRLARALQVVADVGGTVPLTLVVDPELLDEIWVMANKPYQVRDGTKLVPGAGKDVATEWLAQFRNVLSTDPGVQVELTPYADPDVQTLDEAGLSWQHRLPAAMTADVSDALSGRALDSTLAWASSGAISASTLATLTKDGVSTVVLDASAVHPRPARGAVPVGLARLESGGTDIAAALTSPTLERYVARTIAPASTGGSALPDLLAELAIRAAQEPDVQHTVMLTPPRYVDPDVAAAVQTIKQTSSSTFTRPIALRTAVSGALLPTGRSGLAAVRTSPIGTSNPAMQAAAGAVSDLSKIRSMLDTAHDATARAFVQSLPLAIQRAESSAWRDPSQAGAASSFADELADTTDQVITGVRIVIPSSGGLYTLASNSSPLPITVDNELPYAVDVQLSITTIPEGLAGFSVRLQGVQHVDSKQKRTLKIPTTIESSGRIRIRAVLLTPNGLPLGEPQDLTVRSTALGTVGVIITITAGVVLALALLVRFARRLRKRRSKNVPPLPPARIQQPEPAA